MTGQNLWDIAKQHLEANINAYRKRRSIKISDLRLQEAKIEEQGK